MKNQDNFSHAASVLPVIDMQKSIDFYVQKLDFKLTFSWGEPANYAVMKRGGVSIHLTQRADEQRPSDNHVTVYIFVRDIDEIYNQCVERNVTLLNSPQDKDYNMVDFDIRDPDGYIICFGNGE